MNLGHLSHAEIAGATAVTRWRDLHGDRKQSAKDAMQGGAESYTKPQDRGASKNAAASSSTNDMRVEAL